MLSVAGNSTLIRVRWVWACPNSIAMTLLRQCRAAGRVATGRKQRQAMRADARFGTFAERGYDSAPREPLGELVAIVGAAILPGFAGGSLHQRLVEIRKVGDEAHRGAVAHAHGANRIHGSALYIWSDAQETVQGTRSTEWVDHIERVKPSPGPGYFVAIAGALCERGNCFVGAGR